MNLLLATVFGMEIDWDYFVTKAIDVAFILGFAIILLILNKAIFGGLASRAKKREKLDLARLLGVIRVAIKILVWVFAVFAVLYQIEALSSMLTAILASSGVLALAVGIASQDAASNVIGGVLILIFKPFVTGDLIKLVSSGTVGTVEEITFRHTVLKTIENKRIIIPNSVINNETIENANITDTAVCNYVEIGVTYESDLEKAKAIVAEEGRKHPNVIDRRTEEQIEAGEDVAKVILFRLDDSAVVLRLAVWSQDVGSGFVAKCDIMESVKARFDAQAGVEMAYPHVVVVQK